MLEPTPWDEFLTSFRWRQGEHVSAIAPTGAGKTTLLTQLMPYRKANIVFGTKVADKLYNHMISKLGYRRVESIREVRPNDYNILLWPRNRDRIPETVLAQRLAFAEAMDVIVKQRAWTVWVDEAKYINQMLRLGTELTFCLEQLRSINATVICGAQRPTFIPRSALSNSTHVFLWKTTDADDLNRLSDIGGVDKREIRTELSTLDDHEFLYIRTRGTNAKVVRTQVKER
jgi:type IV secretory pathway VirB4 component